MGTAGRGTAFSTFLLQIHYKLPLESVDAAALQRAAYRDSSGVVLSLSTRQRPLNAWTFEFMEQNMNVPPTSEGIEYISHMPANM